MNLDKKRLRMLIDWLAWQYGNVPKSQRRSILLPTIMGYESSYQENIVSNPY